MVCDIQEYEFVHMYQSDLVSLQMIRMIKGMQTLNVPVVLTEHIPEEKGATLPEIDAVLHEDSESYPRTTFSALADKRIKKKMDGLKAHTLIVCGTEAHISVLQTALDALEQGYQVVVAEDTISARTMADKQSAINRLTQEGAKSGTVESILFELCGDTAAQEYKAVAKLVG